MSRENTPDPKKEIWTVADTVEDAYARAMASRADMEKLYAQAMQAPPVHGSGVYSPGTFAQAASPAPLPRPGVGASDRDLQWVWKYLPAGSTIHVVVHALVVTMLPPGDAPPVSAALGAVPCLRAAYLSGSVPLEANQKEAEAAVTLLSVLAYGETDKLKVVVLQGVQGP